MQGVSSALPPKVVIVGGGIGGLTAALALLKRGVDVEVYEQSAVLKEVGAGVQLGSNGTRVLYALDLKDALASAQVSALESRISGVLIGKARSMPSCRALSIASMVERRQSG